MNRWFGSSSDSSRQASERDQRAARRYIAANALSSDEEVFDDCNTSLSFNAELNLDGETSTAAADMVDAAQSG